MTDTKQSYMSLSFNLCLYAQAFSERHVGASVVPHQSLCNGVGKRSHGKDRVTFKTDSIFAKINECANMNYFTPTFIVPQLDVLHTEDGRIRIQLIGKETRPVSGR